MSWTEWLRGLAATWATKPPAARTAPSCRKSMLLGSSLARHLDEGQAFWAKKGGVLGDGVLDDPEAKVYMMVEREEKERIHQDNWPTQVLRGPAVLFKLRPASSTQYGRSTLPRLIAQCHGRCLHAVCTHGTTPAVGRGVGLRRNERTSESTRCRGGGGGHGGLLLPTATSRAGFPISSSRPKPCRNLWLLIMIPSLGASVTQHGGATLQLARLSHTVLARTRRLLDFPVVVEQAHAEAGPPTSG